MLLDYDKKVEIAYKGTLVLVFVVGVVVAGLWVYLLLNRSPYETAEFCDVYVANVNYNGSALKMKLTFGLDENRSVIVYGVMSDEKMWTWTPVEMYADESLTVTMPLSRVLQKGEELWFLLLITNPEDSEEYALPFKVKIP